MNWSERQNVKNNGELDQYGAEPFEQRQFETAGVEGVRLIQAKSLVFWVQYVGVQYGPFVLLATDHWSVVRVVLTADYKAVLSCSVLPMQYSLAHRLVNLSDCATN